MKALVTGGAGFIGSHLTELLLSLNHPVRVIDNFSTGRKENLKEVLDHPLLSCHEADIRNPQALAPLFEGIDWVFHLAGLAEIIPSIEKPVDYFDVNVQGTLNVLQAARDAHVKRFIYTASSSCYGTPKQIPTPEEALIDPQYPYALTKHMGEQLVMHWHKTYGVNALSLRLFNVFGPRSRSRGSYGAVFGVFLTQKLHNKPLTVVGDGLQTRDFTYVTDVANAFYLAAKSDLSGEIFNVGTGSAQSIKYLTQLLCADTVHVPARPGEPSSSEADVSKIKEKLGWRPMVEFERGVERTLATLQDFHDAPLWNPENIEEATKNWFKYLL